MCSPTTRYVSGSAPSAARLYSCGRDLADFGDISCTVNVAGGSFVALRDWIFESFYSGLQVLIGVCVKLMDSCAGLSL